jgi:hypothetical protein
MKNKLLIGGLLLANAVVAQLKQETVVGFGCSYYGGNIDHRRICDFNGFMSNKEAENVVDRILKPIGLTRNFIVVECPRTENCFAATVNGVRYIVYDKAFLQRVDNRTQTDWAAISIMAHELGHHLQGHTIDGKGSRPDKEIEADKFSGFIMHQLGASLEQAQVAMRVLQGEEGTNTHPPKRSRLTAIEKGWGEAEEMFPKHNSSLQNNKSSTAPVVVRNEPKPIEPSNPNVWKEEKVEVKKYGCIDGNCDNGIGTFLHEAGEKYEGSWLGGLRHGKGMQYYPSGQIKYEGDFNQGRREGYGTYYFKNGDRYAGNFSDNKMNGKGTYYYANGDRFVGEYKDDKRSGKGTLIYSSGKKEISYYLNDKKQNLKNRW